MQHEKGKDRHPAINTPTINCNCKKESEVIRYTFSKNNGCNTEERREELEIGGRKPALEAATQIREMRV